MKYKLNSKQNFYYLRAILGLGVYTRDEINSLGYQKKKRIIKVHRKATAAIEKLKLHLSLDKQSVGGRMQLADSSDGPRPPSDWPRRLAVPPEPPWHSRASSWCLHKADRPDVPARSLGPEY